MKKHPNLDISETNCQKPEKKDRILKADREKRLVIYKECSVRLTADPSSETMESVRKQYHMPGSHLVFTNLMRYYPHFTGM